MSVAGTVGLSYLPIWLDLAQISRTALPGRPRPEFLPVPGGTGSRIDLRYDLAADNAGAVVGRIK